MNETTRNLALGIAIAALVGAGFYFYINRESLPGGSGGQGATTTVTVVDENGQEYTVEVLDIQPPKLGNISIDNSLSGEARTILRSKIEAQYEILRAEPKRVDIWLQLGINRKIGGDYAGAAEAWEYVAAAAPRIESGIAHGNLGDLYMYFLKEYEKGESNFLAAIAVNPYIVDHYRALFYLYRDIYKDNAKAVAILTQGLKANPGDNELLGLQKEL